MPSVLAHNIELAKEFADFIYGAYIVYNLLFFENGGENASEEQKQYLVNEYSVVDFSSSLRYARNDNIAFDCAI